LDIPVVTIGLGAQAADARSASIKWNDSSLRLARLLAAKAPYLSTRGYFTTACLQEVGILNVVTTGCPSIYRDFPRRDDAADEALIIQATRYGVTKSFAETPSLNQALFRFAFEHQLTMIYQSEREEMNYLLKGEAAEFLTSSQHIGALCALYGAETPAALKTYLDERGKVFFDVSEWSRFIQRSGGVLGTRLHGAIMALNSGVPAVLVPHDSRTAEMVAFARIPTAKSNSFSWTQQPLTKIAQVMDQMADYRETRSFHMAIYRQFLTANGLPSRLEA
jgi:hypothetical protein